MLSSPGGRLEPRYDVVVVGSGYGGAVAASRFARAGRSVCVLERGAERHPGEYPETLRAGMRDIQTTSRKRRIGSRTALFDLRLDDEANLLVGCGLGGTSLINANVAIRPRPEVLADERWPSALRSPGALDPYFERAEAWLGTTTYPDTEPTLPKLEALGAIAEAIDIPLQRAPINVTFGPDPVPNPAGVIQPPCNGCGNCVSGCNVGAKNTVLVNYLPDAVRHGAHVFTERSVRTVARRGDEWEIAFDLVNSGRRFFGSGGGTVRADIVVLAAGTLGSTEILLRSAAEGLPTSELVGHRFTGNGDVLGFAYGADREIHGTGWTRSEIVAGDVAPVGPTITGVIPVDDPVEQPGHSLVMEEGAIPGVLRRVMPLMLLVSAMVGSDAGVIGRMRMLFRSWRRAADRTLTYLVMSDDAADGHLVLDDDQLVVDWPGVLKDESIRRNNDMLDEVSGAIGAEYVPEPLWSRAAGREVVSVHPLGGCVMADDASTGVVDERGEVFDGVGGTHRGLHVLDGSVLSRPVDANPSLTITAVAERAVEMICAERGWDLDLSPNATVRPLADELRGEGKPDDADPSTEAALSFTERMSGGFSLGTDDPADGAARGHQRRTGLSFTLTIDIADLGELARDPAAEQRFAGTVEAPELSSAPLTVSDGRFQLLVRHPDRAEEWNMRYGMELVAADGDRYRLDGHKVVTTGSMLKGWRDTTTLFTTLRSVDDNGQAGPVIGAGVLRITVPDLLRQVRAMRTPGRRGLTSMKAKLRFLRLFKGELLPAYGGPLVAPSIPHRPLLRELRLPAPEICWFSPTTGWHDLAGEALDEARLDAVTLAANRRLGDERPPSVLDGVGDDARLMLTHYSVPGATKGPVLLAAGFSMRANSLAHPTTDTTLAEALAAAGFDVWLFDYRSSIALPSCREDHTLDDIAQADWPEAIAEVRRRTGADSVQLVGHCVGSVSILMALLAGVEGVKSAVCSQFFVHPHTSRLNRFKNAIGAVKLFDMAGIEGVTPNTGRTPLDRTIDLVARLAPTPEGEECQEPVCRWLNGVFGLTHTHDQLDADTHDQFHAAFGTGDVETLEHLGLMTKKKRAVDHRGNDIYLPNVERLALPILFVQGTRNYIFRPEGLDATMAWLRNGVAESARLHEALVLDDYAHLDGLVGRSAHVDVFPHIIDHLERHT